MDGMQMYTVLSQEKTTSPYFQDVYSRDTLPPLQENMCAIVNSDDSSQPGTHWVQGDRESEFITEKSDEKSFNQVGMDLRKVQLPCWTTPFPCKRQYNINE
ncbi:hypothetical protein TNCV_3155431 [Trichonephila clavipes]|nr:hypothetical protein TNCV_3155431 [Trichonephila clavipes]